ncbi:hypothetical protein, partial [Planktothrix sp.]|uniref:hypothetical protein n=1 Tax=Planktothrix sp. TaxID=3088171 RepID=UPI0038D36B1F
KQAIKNKKLYVTETSDRPSYWQLFNLANQFGKGLYIIMNSDIYLPAISAEKLIIDSFFTTDQFYALTRWNLTSNGTFLQSVTPSPPWSEIKFSDLSRKDKNYFSYDTYCFNAPISIPESTRKVLLGSYGCDSAIAAIFKSSGFMVSNPCLHYQFVHVDDKPRNYQSNQSRNDLILNVDAVAETIRKKWDKSLIGKSLEYLPSLRRYVAWIGHSGAISPWQAIYRVLGATPWSESIFTKKMNFKKICLTSQQLDSENLSFEPGELLREIENREIFLEWELSGFETPEHIVKLLSKKQSCMMLSDCLSTYPWISMIHIDKAQPEEVSAIFDVIVLIKECLMNYSLHSIDTTNTDPVFPVVLDTPKVITNGAVSLKKIQYLFNEIGPDNNVIFGFNRIIKPGNVAKATIRLSGQINSKLVIILCRDGRTPYEGQNKNVLLTGESQEFDIIHCFDKKHKGIRIQIYSPDGRLTISDVNVVVTIKDSRNNEILTPLVEPCSVNSKNKF